MTSLYPRLGFRDAVELLGELRRAAGEGSDLRGFASTRHPRSTFAATGGSVVSLGEIDEVRQAILRELAAVDDLPRFAKVNRAKFDALVGRTLYGAMDINPGDAGHDTVWSFMTLVVLPDVAILRFPDLHQERMLGGNRNMFRRLWIRQHVLGDLMSTSENPLGEDELVGIFERSELSRNHALARSMARVVLDSRAGNRSEFARRLYKRVRFHTGPVALDLSSEEELLQLCRTFAAEVG